MHIKPTTLTVTQITLTPEELSELKSDLNLVLGVFSVTNPGEYPKELMKLQQGLASFA